MHAGMRIKKREKEKKKEEKERRKTYREEEEMRKKGRGRFSQCFDGRISTVRELKSIHTTRATHGYQNLGVSSNSKR